MTKAEELGGQASIACRECGAASSAGSRFCLACGSPFVRPLRCPNCGSGNARDNRFCSQCGEEIAGPEQRDPRAYIPRRLAEKIRANRGKLEGERKHVTVLFASVVGSLELAENTDPDEAQALTDRLFAILSEGVHRFEGTVEKFTGAGIMALFGAPIAHEDHARRACYAALHLQEQLASYAAELRRSRDIELAVRMGLNSSEVIAGSIGDNLQLFYTAVGHGVGLAQRMESLARPHQVTVAEATARLIEGYFDLRDLGDFDVKGVSDPIRVYELAGVGSVRRPIDMARERGFSRFVGREEEMRELEDVLDKTVSGETQIVGVVGEPGVGKSRLCHEFSEVCRSHAVAVYQAQGQAHTKSLPFLPVIEVLRGYLGIGGEDSDRATRERVVGKLALFDERFADDLPLLFDFLDISGPEDPRPDLNPEARERRLVELVKRLFRAQCLLEPTVTVIEDLHWLDPGTEVFLAALVDALPGTRGSVVVSFRPHYRADWMARSYYRQIPVAALGSAGVDAMLAELVGSDPSLDGLAELISEHTSGNPFFVEELIQSLVEAGNLEGEQGSYRLVESLDQIAVPASVQTVLTARIDRLAERDKAVLLAASVIGKGFSQPVLAAASGLSEDDLAAALKELVAAEYVYEQVLYPHPEYAFKHPLTREVAYGSQLGERRARTHAAVAEAIEDQAGERIEDQAALVAPAAYHWHAAGPSGDPSRALRRCEAAGDVALERTAYGDAVAHFGRALDAVGWAEGDDDAAARLLAKRAEASHRAGTPRERERDAERAAELAAGTGDAVTLCHAALVHGGFRSTYGVANTRTTALLERAYDAVPEGNDALRARVCARLAQERYHVGDYEAARRLSAEGVELARVVGDDETLAAAFHGRAWTLNHPDWLDERTVLADEMIERAIVVRSQEWEMAGRVWRSAAFLEKGDIDGLDTELARLEDLAAVVTVPSDQVRVATLRAARAMMRGDLDRGIELAQQAHTVGKVAEPANADQVLQAQMLVPLREQGQLGAGVPIIEELAERYADAPGWRCAAAFVFCEAGHGDRGREILDSLSRDRFAAVPRDLAWMYAMALLAEVAAVVGNAERIVTLYELMAPYDGRNVGLWDIASGGAVAHYLGILAARAGNREQATQHLIDAIDFNDRTGQLPAALRSRLRLAEVAVANGDLARAVGLAVEVGKVARQRGLTALQEEAGRITAPGVSARVSPAATD